MHDLPADVLRDPGRDRRGASRRRCAGSTRRRVESTRRGPVRAPTTWTAHEARRWPQGSGPGAAMSADSGRRRRSERPASRRWRCRTRPSSPGSRPRVRAATPASTAALRKLRRPSAESAKSTSGLIGGQIRGGDLLAALDQHVAEQRRRGGIGVAARVDGGANHLVGERGDAPRRPERVVGARAQEARRSATRGCHALRIELVALESADRGVLDVVHRLPRLDEEAERHQPLPRQLAVVEQLPALVVLARAVGAGAERGPDILQVVPHHAAAVLGRRRCRACCRPSCPRGWSTRRTPSARAARGGARAGRRRWDRRDACRSSGIRRSGGPARRGRRWRDSCRRRCDAPREDVVEIARLHRALSSRTAGVNVAFSAMTIWSRRDGDQIVLDLPVAERPEDLVGDHDRAGRGFGMAGGVERHEPELAARVAHREARREAGQLARDHGPGSGCRAVAGERAARRPRRRVSGRARMRLVNQFESGTSSIVLTLLRAHVRSSGRRAGANRLVGEIDEQIDLPFLHLRRRPGSRARAPAGRRRRTAARRRRAVRGAGGQEAAQRRVASASRAGRRHDQNAALAANTSLHAFGPLAPARCAAACGPARETGRRRRSR